MVRQTEKLTIDNIDDKMVAKFKKTFPKAYKQMKQFNETRQDYVKEVTEFFEGQGKDSFVAKLFAEETWDSLWDNVKSIPETVESVDLPKLSSKDKRELNKIKNKTKDIIDDLELEKKAKDMRKLVFKKNK